MTPDPVREAIARTQAAERLAVPRPPRPMVQLSVPADMTDAELLELVAFLTTQFRQQAAAARVGRPASRILVPR